jgi:hypothetical protein
MEEPQMERQRRQTRERFGNGQPAVATLDPALDGGGGAAAATDGLLDSNVQVIFGANVQMYPLAGLPVTHARDVLGAILPVGAHDPVLVNGRPVRLDHRLVRGDVLEFVHHAGEKGAECHGRPGRDRRRSGRL